MKVFKAPFSKMKAIFKQYLQLKKALKECNERNTWLNWQIDKYNRENT